MRTPRAPSPSPQCARTGATSAEFDVDDDVSGHPGLARKLMLGHATFKAQLDYALINRTSPLLPNLYALGIVLAGACRHFHKLSGWPSKPIASINISTATITTRSCRSIGYAIPFRSSQAVTSSSLAMSLRHSKVTPPRPLSTAFTTPDERPTPQLRSSRLSSRSSRKRDMREPT